MNTEPLPWTVAAFAAARKRTWRAIRVWLALLLLSVIAFQIPFWLQKDHVTTRVGFLSYHLSLACRMRLIAESF
jgi:hypothetical protein